MYPSLKLVLLDFMLLIVIDPSYIIKFIVHVANNINLTIPFVVKLDIIIVNAINSIAPFIGFIKIYNFLILILKWLIYLLLILIRRLWKFCLRFVFWALWFRRGGLVLFQTFICLVVLAFYHTLIFDLTFFDLDWWLPVNFLTLFDS
jgi:hypothetical protein